MSVDMKCSCSSVDDPAPDELAPPAFFSPSSSEASITSPFSSTFVFAAARSLVMVLLMRFESSTSLTMISQLCKLSSPKRSLSSSIVRTWV
jgi:hypothetical protein